MYSISQNWNLPSRYYYSRRNV